MDICISNPSLTAISRNKIQPNHFVQYYYQDNSSVTLNIKDKTIMYYDHNLIPLYDKWHEISGPWENEIFDKATSDNHYYHAPFTRCPVQ